jgi:hypothetical protein
VGPSWRLEEREMMCGPDLAAPKDNRWVGPGRQRNKEEGRADCGPRILVGGEADRWA